MSNGKGTESWWKAPESQKGRGGGGGGGRQKENGSTVVRAAGYGGLEAACLNVDK